MESKKNPSQPSKSDGFVPMPPMVKAYASQIVMIGEATKSMAAPTYVREAADAFSAAFARWEKESG